MPDPRNQSKKSNSPNFQKILHTKDQLYQGPRKNQIKDLELGDYYEGIVKILRKVKPGPVIMTVFDGSGKIEAIAHDSLFEQMRSMSTPTQVKTYDFGNIQIKDSRNKNKPSLSEVANTPQSLQEADLQVDQTIKIEGKVHLHRDSLEIVLENIIQAEMDFDALIRTKSAPTRTSFSITSKRYESMKSRFVDIAQRIRYAIIDQQPILIRHHNDADGICAGLAIEQAILKVMERSEINPKNLLYRSPSVSPFYDQIDLFRDISKFNRYTDTFGDKSPLVLLLDTGSTPENEFSLKVLQSFGFECIVVDHHNPGEIVDGKSVICDLLQFHLNPYLFGWDNQTCGGMLCYELARFIDEEYYQPLYPAVAALGDRCDIPEVDLLIANTDKTRDELMQIARVIDYLAYNFKFDGGDSVYDKLFIHPQIVETIGLEVEHMFRSSLDSILPTVHSETINGIFYTEVDLEKYTQRGKYPTPGKIVGMVHDNFVEAHGEIPVFTVGFFSDGIIIRATHPIVPVPDLLHMLQNELPEASVDGGGHEQAGSLKFLGAFITQILEIVRREIGKAHIEV